MPQKKIRVHELAKELGMTNQETLDLALALGIGVKTHSSSIEDPQADRVRRRADADGLRRDVQPEEPAPVKKAPAKKAAASKKAAATQEAAPASDAPAPSAPAEKPLAPAAAAPSEPEAPAPSAPRVTTGRVVTSRPASEVTAPRPMPEPPAPRSAAPRPSPNLDMPPRPRPAAPAAPAAAPAAPVSEPAAPAPVAPAASTPVETPAAPVAPAASTPADAPPAPTAPAGDAPVAPAASTDAAAPGAPATPPMSASGKPIPPPPGPPRSASGKMIPPPPGQRRPAGPGGAPGAGARGPGGPGGRGGPSAGGAPGRPMGARPGGGAGGGGGGGGGYRGGPGGGGAGGGFGAGFGTRGGPAGPPGRGGPGGGPGQRRGPARRRRRRRDMEELGPTAMTTYVPSSAPVPDGEVIIERGSSAQEVGPKLNRSAGDVVRFLFQQGEMVTASQSLSDDAIELFAVEVNAAIKLVDPGLEREAELTAKFFGDEDDEDDEESLRPRPPIITVMGHVDHGKTLLLDRIRSANVVAGEAGGITQHIGAYQTTKDGRLITFIDTPGHEAFTAMRARGAEVTDIVILMVAADDGLMPQTEEAIDHARAAEVPIVVALNKIDRENANPERVKTQLSEKGLMPEEWGGDTIVCEISALQNTGIDELLEQLLLVADVQLADELVANPEGRCRGVVLEANLDTGRGPVATVIVENGTLRVGDTIVAGAAWGRIRALIDDTGANIKEALPSTPVVVLGLNDVPAAGDEFRVADDKAAKVLAEHREHRQRYAGLASTAAATGGGAKLEDIFEQIQRGEKATLNVILKSDVHGSMEAVTASLQKLERDEVKLGFVRRAVGGITESDIQLAATSGSTIIGFNVRPDRKARELADNLGVEIRLYEIIYKLLEDLEAAMVGMLKPEYEEVVTGEAEVREVFSTPKGKVAGCLVQSGVITRNSKVRYLREGTIIWKGSLPSLRRFKDDVREVAAGFECGMLLSDFADLKEGDIIETYDEREIPRS